MRPRPSDKTQIEKQKHIHRVLSIRHLVETTLANELLNIFIQFITVDLAKDWELNVRYENPEYPRVT